MKYKVFEIPVNPKNSDSIAIELNEKCKDLHIIQILPMTKMNIVHEVFISLIVICVEIDS